MEPIALLNLMAPSLIFDLHNGSTSIKSESHNFFPISDNPETFELIIQHLGGDCEWTSAALKSKPDWYENSDLTSKLTIDIAYIHAAMQLDLYE